VIRPPVAAGPAANRLRQPFLEALEFRRLAVCVAPHAEDQPAAALLLSFQANLAQVALALRMGPLASGHTQGRVLAEGVFLYKIRNHPAITEGGRKLPLQRPGELDDDPAAHFGERLDHHCSETQAIVVLE